MQQPESHGKIAEWQNALLQKITHTLLIYVNWKSFVCELHACYSQCSYCFDIWVGPFIRTTLVRNYPNGFCVPCFHWLKICEKTTWHTYTQFMSKQMVKNSKNNFNAWYCCGIHSQMPVRYCEGTTFRSVEHIVQKHLWFQTLALLHDSIVRTYVGTKSCLRNGGTVWLDRRFDIGAHITKWWW